MTRQCDFPVFDADNHLYETQDALHPPPARSLQAGDRLRRGRGAARRSRSAARSATTSRTRPSTSWPDRAPRRSTSATATRRASRYRELIGEPMRCIPAFREPGPRLELMDELGVDRALMFPTLASLLEERMRDDPELIHAVIHALNEWLHETWSFDYEDRIFTTPVITLPIVDKAIEELEWVRRARRQDGAHPPGPGSRATAVRARSALPEFDPFWQRVVELDVLVAMHASDSGYSRYQNDWTGPREMLPFVLDPFQLMMDKRAPDRRHDGRARLPRPAQPVPRAADRCRSRTAAAGWSRSSTRWRTPTRRCPRPSPRTRSRRSSATST